MKLRKQSQDSLNGSFTLVNVFLLLGIKLGQEEIDNYKGYPEYPSFEWFNRVLNENGIDSLSVKIGLDRLKDIEFPSIAHLSSDNGTFVILTSIDHSSVEYFDSSKGRYVKEKLSAFQEHWTGNLILLDKVGDLNLKLTKKREASSRVKLLRNISFFFIATLWLTFNYIVQDVEVFICNLIVTFGCIVSIEIIKIDFLEPKAVFCQIGKKFDCLSVLNSGGSSFFGLFKMSELGLIWFNSIMIYLLVYQLIPDESNSYLKVLSLVSFISCLYIPVSLYYQFHVIKKICILCLTILLIILSQAVFSYFYLPIYEINDFHFMGIIPYVCSVLLAISIWILFKPNILKEANLAESKYRLSKFSNDLNVFNFLLEQTFEVTNYDSVRIPFSQSRRELNVLMVIDPFCGACKKSFEDLLPLVTMTGNELSFDIIFFIKDPNRKLEGHRVISLLIDAEPEKRLQILADWFEKGKTHSELDEFDEGIVENHLHNSKKWIELNNITVTPKFFVNNKEVSDKYISKDLKSLLSYKMLQSKTL
ncbi:vitamin K epoxide reductase family protein [Roseivirga pacifica]|uniref:vitamin K epoxide reductase family protein n=1 Tax=Roseivirga pacifica TaxID=1267423 RepID=UPI002279F664|nr:vitamin K epoxide reductase family protein [Roseivirga pacifica]